MNEGAADTFLVETAEQLKALSDPFRQRLLEQFARAATVKEAAARLGLPLTRLYHHVDLLLAAGLIRVAGEVKRRAVIERSFESVARRFAVSPAAFGGESGGGGGRAGERGRIARANVEELLGGAEDKEGAFRLLRTRLPLSQAGREKLEAGLQRLLDELREPGAPYVDLLMMSARQS